ncbi:MAG: hypothetical protein U1E83_09875 [Methylotetracoccus sp.]
MRSLRKAAQLPLLLCSASLLIGCPQREQAEQSADGGTPAAPQAAARDQNDFPTQARVEYVLQCMVEHGGQNYDNLYHCVCAVDLLASRMSYDEFGQAQTFTYLFNTPGERGGEFRDPPESKRLRTLYKEARTAAESSCFPKKPQPADASGAAPKKK